MQIHASCAARDGAGVLLMGPPGSGKSDLLVRLIDRGFALVADDRVDVTDGIARPPPALAGLIEVRGLGIMRMAHAAQARLALAVVIGRPDRLPEPSRHPVLGLHQVVIDPRAPAAPLVVDWALDCALGRRTLHTGAFEAGGAALLEPMGVS